jgi:hypothetical protein
MIVELAPFLRLNNLEFIVDADFADGKFVHIYRVYDLRGTRLPNIESALLTEIGKELNCASSLPFRFSNCSLTQAATNLCRWCIWAMREDSSSMDRSARTLPHYGLRRRRTFPMHCKSQSSSNWPIQTPWTNAVSSPKAVGIGHVGVFTGLGICR